MAAKKKPSLHVNFYDDTKKCNVCNGPRRVPTRVEVLLIEGSVEKARDAVEAIRRELWPLLDSDQWSRVQPTMERLEEACVQRGEQEARAQLIPVVV